MPKFDVKNIEIPEAAAKPVYAYVGATDLAVEKVREVVTEVQGKVTAKVTEVRNDVTGKYNDVQKVVKGFEPKDLQSKAVDTAKTRRAQAEQRFNALQADAKELPAKVQADVKARVDQNVATVVSTYGDLAKRGEAVVTRIRGEQAPAAPAEPAPAEKATAKKAPAKKSAAKKTAAKKAPAKKTAAKKTAAK